MNIEQFKVCCFTWNFVFLVKWMLHDTFYQFCHVQRQRRLVLKIVQTFLSSWHSIMRKNECTSNFFVKCKCNFFSTGWWSGKRVMKVQGAWKVYDLCQSVNSSFCLLTVDFTSIVLLISFCFDKEKLFLGLIPTCSPTLNNKCWS